MEDRRALWAFIATATALRLAFAATLGVGNDEAYHALLALHPDWSYYDHPPMLAMVGRLGLMLSGGAPSPFALRLGFIALSAGTTLLMARLAGRLFGPRAALIAALSLNFTAYYGVAAATFALPDGPLLFFWLLTIDRLSGALEDADSRRLGPWIGVGLAWGGAMLSKYHAVFLPCGLALFALIEPKARRLLRDPGPYLALSIGLVMFAPVIAWNAAHGWASFAFQAGRAVGGPMFQWKTLLGAIGGQAMYLFPWLWLFLWGALGRSAGRWRRGEDLREPGTSLSIDRFLVCQTIPPLLAFLAVACRRAVFPHWSLIGLIPAFPLLGHDWAAMWPAASPRLRQRLIVLGLVPIAGAILLVAQARTGFLQKGGHGTLGLIAPDKDPTVELIGWGDITAELRRRGWLDRPDLFVFTSKWYASGHLTFATGNRVPILCFDPHGGHSFDDWSDPAATVGRDGLLVVVGRGETEPGMYGPWFAGIVPEGEFDVERAGAAVRRVRLYRCVRQLRPFPDGSLRLSNAAARHPGGGRLR